MKAAYLGLLESGGLARRVEALRALLGECSVCPRHCGVNRLEDRRSVCRTGKRAEVSSWCLHRGEEPCISGRRGSGTVFFAHCNLACLFCQNYQISQEWPEGGRGLEPERLAEVYLGLQSQGAHNLNWVSPSHVVPQAVEALAVAAERGFELPVVYNSNGYDALETLRLLDGIVDVYMPDMKYADDAAASDLSKAAGYSAAAKAALREMWRQVGPLVLDKEGVAVRGLLVRHLVLPNGMSQTQEVMDFLAKDLGRDVTVSLLAQYYPAYLAGENPLVCRRITAGEYARALESFDDAGLSEGYLQELSSQDHYLPDFDSDGHPFER